MWTGVQPYEFAKKKKHPNQVFEVLVDHCSPSMIHFGPILGAVVGRFLGWPAVR